jgi:tetratricopeptide (TPR) repeat protein
MKRPVLYPAMLTFFAAVLLLAPACNTSGKTVKKQPGHETPAVESLNNKPDNKPGKYGSDSLGCIRNLSLYREFVRVGEYVRALPPWRKAFEICPASAQNLYIDGVAIYKQQHSLLSDEAEKNAVVDTLMLLYDKRIEYFGNRGMVLGRKAADLFSYRPDAAGEAYLLFRESADIERNMTKPWVVVPFLESAFSLHLAGQLDTTSIFSLYHEMISVCEYNVISGSEDSTLYRIAMQRAREIFLAGYPCSSIQNVVLKSGQSSLMTSGELVLLLEKAGCYNSSLYIEKATPVYESDPDFGRAMLLASAHQSAGAYQKAQKYLDEAYKLAVSAENRYSAAVSSARLFLSTESYELVRQYALLALEAKPGAGEPHILIGDAYAASFQLCGNTSIEKSAVFWAAADRYTLAVKDADVKQGALRKLDWAKSQFPDKKTLFFNKLNIGSEYELACWIKVKTTVRSSD